jgi:hypothetical protein
VRDERAEVVADDDVPRRTDELLDLDLHQLRALLPVEEVTPAHAEGERQSEERTKEVRSVREASARVSFRCIFVSAACRPPFSRSLPCMRSSASSACMHSSGCVSVRASRSAHLDLLSHASFAVAIATSYT